MNDTIQFRCECGATLTAPRAKAGGKGKCRRCGKIAPIPTANELEPATAIVNRLVNTPVQSPARETTSAICGVCQTALQPSDESTHCNACQLPFHVECWLENFGCSAYGCRNVNVLKTTMGGPSIPAYGAAHANQAPAMLPYGSASQFPMGATRPGLMGGEFPWEYLLLVVSGVGVLLGLISFGVVSLAFGIFAGAAFAFAGKGKSPLPFVACMLISLLGFIVGAIVSAIMYF